jgi:aarF domain-containing kinase
MSARYLTRPDRHHLVTTLCLLCRKIGVYLRRLPEIKTDIPALIDEWAARFFEELDYVREGQNATRFAESIREVLPQVFAAAYA